MSCYLKCSFLVLGCVLLLTPMAWLWDIPEAHWVAKSGQIPFSQAHSPGNKLTGVSSQPARVVLPQWMFQPGPVNAITDVPGVRVGHVTVQRDLPFKVRTGVTAVVPHSQNLATMGLWANGMMLHGNGELTGLAFVQSTGVLNSPILLTNTFAVGRVYQGVFDYYQKHYPGPTPGSMVWTGQLPVVGECYDGFYNTIEDKTAVLPADTVKAIESAKSGPVPQGRVGAGTGMRSFGMHAGIGSASRRIPLGGKTYTLGVLVNANHSRLTHLNPQIRDKLAVRWGKPLEQVSARDDKDQVGRTVRSSSRQGSIMVVIATDMPLLPHQLGEVAKRAAMGIGAMGSTMDTTSGDGVIALSTAYLVPLDEKAPTAFTATALHPDQLSPVYRATVEAVTEAQINALLASHTR